MTSGAQGASYSEMAQMMLLGNELRNTSLRLDMPPSVGKITMTKLATLTYISEYEETGIAQRDLEAHLRIRRSSVSTLVRGLEKDGLILRIPVPEDARLKQVVLTKKGREASKILKEHQKKVDTFMEQILTLEEREMLAKLIEKLMYGIDTRREEEQRKK